MTRGPTRRLFGVALLLASVCAASSPARADYDETERRLKAVGVDDALRKKIHDSIDRGVKFLIARQQMDGGFAEHGSSTWGPRGHRGVGVTLLCALALRHSGLPGSGAPVANAIRYALSKHPVGEPTSDSGVYEAGLALMLLAADPGHADVASRIAAYLALAQAKCGWWNYNKSGPGHILIRSDPVTNISTSQFAALGLWAAKRMELPVSAEVWMRHAQALCEEQMAPGLWAYWHSSYKREPTCIGSAYPQGTYMAVANLVLAREGMRGASVPDDLLKRIDRAIEDGRVSLHLLAPETLDHPNGDLPPGLNMPSGPGIGAYYTLYALEKACLFLGVEEIERKGRGRKIPWYATGAKWLLSVQAKDGGWPPGGFGGDAVVSSEVETAFALLFLLRSPSVFHPTTPTEVDAKPRGETTPTEPGAPAMGG